MKNADAWNPEEVQPRQTLGAQRSESPNVWEGRRTWDPRWIYKVSELREQRGETWSMLGCDVGWGWAAALMQEAERRPGIPRTGPGMSLLGLGRGTHMVTTRQVHNIHGCPGQADPTHPLSNTGPGLLPGPVRNIPTSLCRMRLPGLCRKQLWGGAGVPGQQPAEAWSRLAWLGETLSFSMNSHAFSDTLRPSREPAHRYAWQTRRLPGQAPSRSQKTGLKTHMEVSGLKPQARPVPPVLNCTDAGFPNTSCKPCLESIGDLEAGGARWQRS